MIAHCERMGDRMAILDPLPDLNPQEVKKWREVGDQLRLEVRRAVLPVDQRRAAPMASRWRVPPSRPHRRHLGAQRQRARRPQGAGERGHARRARSRGQPITKGEQDTLNPIGVNCIRAFTGRGVRVWGARTLSSDPAWRYINVRRLFNYVEKSIERGTQWVVFEPNDPDLWARVRRDVGAFLTGVWRDGMLFGRTPEEAFFVKCDAELNPPEVRDRGQADHRDRHGAGQAGRVRDLPLQPVSGRRAHVVSTAES